MEQKAKIPVLYIKKEDCCGCGACMQICPGHAIQMLEDEEGFEYPEIIEKLCRNCGICKRICPVQKKM